MTPVVALVGRPNVGKSTLFNHLTQSRAALVADIPGLTHDRQYGQVKLHDANFIVIDTGGIAEEETTLQDRLHTQTLIAVDEADLVLLLVDAKDGLTTADEKIAKDLRQHNRSVLLVINKADNLNDPLLLPEFAPLGFKENVAIAANTGRGVPKLLKKVHEKSPPSEPEITEETQDKIIVSVIGKPNVGKSTLINQLLGEERVLVLDQPGTTRDSIYIPFSFRNREYTLVDTAGVRRRSRVSDEIEKLAILKTMQAINASNVSLFLIDAREDLSEQDLRMLGHIIDAGKSLVIAVNKWDGLSNEIRERVKKSLDRKLGFVNYAKIHFISALKGTGIKNVFYSINKAYQSAKADFKTAELTRLLEKALRAHPPPLVRGRRIKLRYAHQGGKNPPLIIVYGKQTASLPKTYQRYLSHFFRESLNLSGTPVLLAFKTDPNPYEDKKNRLTERQMHRRKRLMKHVKKK